MSKKRKQKNKTFGENKIKTNHKNLEIEFLNWKNDETIKNRLDFLTKILNYSEKDAKKIICVHQKYLNN